MSRERPTAWVGWIYFGATMLMIAGGLQVIAGLTGIFNADFYAVAEGGRLLTFDFSTWGWIHLVMGIVAIVASIALTMGKLWARFIVLVIAILTAITNLAFISAYPLWSITSLILIGFVIYAITLHGDEVA